MMDAEKGARATAEVEKVTDAEKAADAYLGRPHVPTDLMERLGLAVNNSMR